MDQIAFSPQEAAEVGAKSLTAYGHLFFPRTFRQESPKFHEDIGNALYSHSRFNAFEIFRDGAKTTLLRTYKSQRIAYGLSRTVLYVSVSQKHSMFSVRWLRRQVMYNKRWANTFGLAQGDKWTDEWCEIKHHNLTNEDGTPAIITVLAVGVTGQIRGFNLDDFRPDLIIIDDVLDDENTATIEQIKKIEALLFGAILNSLAPASESPLAKAVFLQTPFNKKDAIEKCMSDPEWKPMRFGCFDEAGESRWPQRYPTEMLKAAKEAHIRRSQYRLWMREKECQIVTGEEKALDVTKLRYYDTLPEYLDVLISIDPASSEKDTADENVVGAIGFVGVDVYLLDYAAAKKTMPDQCANQFFELTLLYRPRKGVVEANGYQRVLKWFLEQEMIKRRIFVAMELLEVRTSNADRIMQTLPGLMAYGHLHIRPSHTSFIQQADDYDPSVKGIADDILTMLANGIVVSNPAIKSRTIEGQYTVINEQMEREYKPLRLRGAP